MIMGWILESNGGVTITVKATPRANKNEIAGADADWLRVRLKAPPVDGKANEALVKFFAELFSVAKNAVSIISGDTSRLKRVHIAGITATIAQSKLNTEG